MVEKYLIWPLRVFLYSAGLFLIIFYTAIGFLSLNDISSRVVNNIYGKSLTFSDIEFKPRILGLEVSAEEILFVSSNGWDAAAAGLFGFKTIWANRAGMPVERLPSHPDFIAPSLDFISEHLSSEAVNKRS